MPLRHNKIFHFKVQLSRTLSTTEAVSPDDKVEPGEVLICLLIQLDPALIQFKRLLGPGTSCRSIIQYIFFNFIPFCLILIVVISG